MAGDNSLVRFVFDFFGSTGEEQQNSHRKSFLSRKYRFNAVVEGPAVDGSDGSHYRAVDLNYQGDFRGESDFEVLEDGVHRYYLLGKIKESEDKPNLNFMLDRCFTYLNFL